MEVAFEVKNTKEFVETANLRIYVINPALDPLSQIKKKKFRLDELKLLSLNDYISSKMPDPFSAERLHRKYADSVNYHSKGIAETSIY